MDRVNYMHCPCRTPSETGDMQLGAAPMLNSAEYESNSLSFHNAFSEKISIREDGLLVNKDTGKVLGCSKLDQSRFLNPQLYSMTGILRGGTKQQLLNVAASLPGLNSAWKEVPDKQDILESFQPRRDAVECTLAVELHDLCSRLAYHLADESYRVMIKPNVPLGAYGVVAYSERRDSLRLNHFEPQRAEALPSASYVDNAPEPEPAAAAIVGNSDFAFIYGAGSGEKELEDIVAICAIKYIRNSTGSNYHLAGRDLCAQLFTSLIGSEAPLGVVVTNGKFKFVWKEEVDGAFHFYTYPSGNDLASFDDPVEKEFFVAVMFDVVRCSTRNGEEKSTYWRYIIRSRRSNENRNNSNNARPSDGVTRGVAIDGSLFTFAPYDFTDWSDIKYHTLKKTLRQEQRRSRQELPNDQPAYMSDYDDSLSSDY